MYPLQECTLEHVEPPMHSPLHCAKIWQLVVVQFSNKYSPEMLVKHTGKKEKKSRTLKLPIEITAVFHDYVVAYKVDDALFPYTHRFLRYLLTETAPKAGIKKRVSAQILRDPCAVRQLKRGEGLERVLLRLGLSETTWEDAKVKYAQLRRGGI
jgi:hypothetical protein